MLNDFTVVDLETTGLDPLTGRITEIAARRYRNGKLAGALSLLVKTDVAPEPDAVALNGLTADTPDRHGLPEAECLQKLFLLLGDSVLVAHNASFEVSWLHQARLRVFGDAFYSDFLCTKTLAVALGAGSGTSYSLKQLTADFSIAWTGASHRAMPDVVATKALLDILTREHIGGMATAEGLYNCCGVSLDKKNGAHYPLPAGLPVYVKEVQQ